jgi:hypothetical protein
MWVGGQHHVPAALPPGKTRYPLYRRLGGLQWPVWTGAENLAPPPPGFDPRTVQTVASRYNDWNFEASIPYSHVKLCTRQSAFLSQVSSHCWRFGVSIKRGEIFVSNCSPLFPDLFFFKVSELSDKTPTKRAILHETLPKSNQIKLHRYSHKVVLRQNKNRTTYAICKFLWERLKWS